MEFRSTAVFLIVAGFGPQALAQEAEGPLQFRIGGVSYQLDADIDDGGEFNVTRAGVGIGAMYEFDPDLKLDAHFGYEYSHYDFSESAGFGGLNPWEHINTIRLRGTLTRRIDNRWSVFGGPILTFSGEDGADFDDTFEGGGVVGFNYRSGDELSLGFGVSVVSQIGDDAQFFPVFLVNWKFADNWTLRNAQVDLGLAYGGGLEAATGIAEDWELAIGAKYQWRRFRLDDGGVAPDGGRSSICR